VAATAAGGVGANSGLPSGPISGSDSNSFFQAGREGEEVVAGLGWGGGATAPTPHPSRARGPWVTGNGSAGSGDSAATRADTTLVTTRVMDG
jgi:hypothetical protein